MGLCHVTRPGVDRLRAVDPFRVAASDHFGLARRSSYDCRKNGEQDADDDIVAALAIAASAAFGDDIDDAHRHGGAGTRHLLELPGARNIRVRQQQGHVAEPDFTALYRQRLSFRAAEFPGPLLGAFT